MEQKGCLVGITSIVWLCISSDFVSFFIGFLYFLFHSSAIGTAFAVLSNPEKRSQYDQFGDKEDTFYTNVPNRYNYYREFEADITPEEIFNMFFGGNFPTGIFFFKLCFKVQRKLLFRHVQKPLLHVAFNC